MFKAQFIMNFTLDHPLISISMHIVTLTELGVQMIVAPQLTMLDLNIVFWSSKKRATISHSSTEAEYRSLVMTTSEFIWLQSLLTELGQKSSQLLVLWCDNLGATFLATNPVFHIRTKHIELVFHFVHEKLATKQLAIHFLCLANQITDVFTKSHHKIRFQTLIHKLTV
jgi:hypothetical protein